MMQKLGLVNVEVRMNDKVEFVTTQSTNYEETKNDFIAYNEWTFDISKELGKNKFGHVYVQGERCPVSSINNALRRAGGKPQRCPLGSCPSEGGTLKSAMPEYIITFEHELNTLIVVECKKSV